MIYDEDRKPITNARQAAEALFAPKRLNSDPRRPPKAGTPRVLPALKSTTTIRQETAAGAPPVVEQPASPEISAKVARRIQTLVKYGMTVAQVAGVYGVPVETIARILRKS